MAINGYYTLRQAADKLDVQRPQVSKYLAAGRFKGAVRVGNQILIPRRQVDNFRKNDVGRPKSLSR